MLLNKTKFRYDINALRAIAVLAVILFHYKVPFFSGGFSGVDIFFVISGYLMTRIVINGLDRNNFSFGEFYGKRVKRIVPALLFLIFLLIIICFFIYLPDDYQEIHKNALSSILFYSNIFYWRHSNYFDPVSDSNLFLHTWSLSVEWQFYLLYPVALFLFLKIFKNRGRYKWFHTVLTLVIFIISIFFTFKSPTPSFYLLPTRSWEMLFGGVIFLWSGMIALPHTRKITALTGYAALILCVVFLKSTMAWPGIFTLLPVLATGLIILADFNDFDLLKNRVIQFMGKVSYSLYLWHWPVYVIAQYLRIDMTASAIALLILISITCSYVSYTFIESLEFKNSKPIYAVALCLVALTAFFSSTTTNDFMFKDMTIQIANYPKNHPDERKKQFSEGCCFINSSNIGLADFNKKECLKFVNGQKNILLIGDSHAAQFSSSLRELLKKQNINLLQATASGCIPIIKKNGELRCSEVIDYIYHDYIPKNATKIDGVMICANWVNCDPDHPEDLLSDILLTINYLKDQGIATILLGQNESYLIPYPTIVAKDYQYQTNKSEKSLDKSSYVINKFLAQRLRPYYVNIINTDTFPGLDKNNAPYMFDKNHLTKYGADLASYHVLSNPITRGFLHLH